MAIVSTICACVTKDSRVILFFLLFFFLTCSPEPPANPGDVMGLVCRLQQKLRGCYSDKQQLQAEIQELSESLKQQASVDDSSMI